MFVQLKKFLSYEEKKAAKKHQEVYPPRKSQVSSGRFEYGRKKKKSK